MGAVRNAPSVVGHHDGGVDDVSDEIVQLFVVAEALVSAIVTQHKERPEHGALGCPVERPQEGVADGVGGIRHAEDDGEILDEV